jgi:ribosomal protein S18 acetylase RimI-like enzyme
MLEIKPLTTFRPEEVARVMPGYTSEEKYLVTRTESDDASRITFDLQRVTLDQPYVKQWDHTDAETHQRYSEYITQGLSLGVYDDGVPVGIALAEKHLWNRSLWIWEFGVAASHRRQGIGRRLMDMLAESARANDLRRMFAETQNTNVPAIDFYRRIGFEFDAVNLSLYTDDLIAAGEVAIFMKQKL